MANICSVEIQIHTSGASVAAKYRDEMLRRKRMADAEEIGVYIGSERYLFDSDISICGSSVLISGWVKWAINDDEVFALIENIKRIIPLTSLNLKYEECGCLLYGEYIYDGECLTDYNLPQAFFPDFSEDEDFYDAMENAFGIYKVARIVSEK